ncbi:DUF1254 domain-containing protein [Paucibacter sp. KBW04]|uniref:DUF1254 domain-containing protein n=1 Tax=Paucibacter sp. KBW04 TaxID=2153361 RepID=UPI0018CC2FDA|nr:DUF1254 domain-containing protein [Paucibacter sp. KBW04]
MKQLTLKLIGAGILCASCSLWQFPAVLAQPVNSSPPSSPAIPAQTAQGLETLAYAQAVQAIVFSYPLFISERERVQREKISSIGAGANPLVAPLNQFGHMRRLVTAAVKNLPVSPNNDTVYSGAVLDLSEQPIVLQTPDILDRFFTVQIANAYIDNLPYKISSRTNGGRASTLAIVGPNWQGKLPEGMQTLRANTNIVMVAPRIRVDDDSDLPTVLAYQSRMSLTALSDWAKGPGATTPKPPALRKRPAYADEFAYYRRMVDLLTENPPLAQDAAAVESMKQLGIQAGKPFDPLTLHPQARAGMLRALKDLPAITDGIRYSRGVETPNHWRTNPEGGRYGLNYVSRAEMALVGLMSNDAEEATYLQTFVDNKGEQMNSANNYVLHLQAQDIPKLIKNGFWSLTMYDAYRFQYAENPINRFKIGNRDKLKFNADGSLDIYIQEKSPGQALESNWLPAPAGAKDFKTTLRIYGPAEGQSEMAVLSTFPGIQKVKP